MTQPTHPASHADPLLGPIDVHVHLSANGLGSSAGWSRRRWIMRPFLRAAARDIGLSGGFGDRDFDRLYVEQLLRWVEDSSLEAAVLLAYDWVRDDDGRERRDLSDLYIANDAVIETAGRSPKLLPGISLHPTRPDLKIPRCLRLPLECGVNVIAAHCGACALPWDGDHVDDFLEMRARHPNLYGDLSPLSHITHLGALERLREAPERLLHGTDYPVVSAVFPSWLKGWISYDEWQRLNRVHNPLEKKIALTRAQGFPAQVFTHLWPLLPPAKVTKFLQRRPCCENPDRPLPKPVFG